MNTRFHMTTRRRTVLCGRYPEVVASLVEKGAEPHKADKGGRTALHWAAFRGHLPVLEVLLGCSEVQQGLDVKDGRGRTALHLAALAGSAVCLETLVRAGANVHAADGEGLTALHVAAANGCEEVVDALLELGVDVNTVNGAGQTALHMATGAELSCEGIVEQLWDKGVDVNLADHKGRTGLHLACQSGNIESIFLLLSDCAAQANLPDSDGNTSLHVAARHGHLSALELLLTYGGELARQGQFGMTPTHVAARYGHTNCVELLLGKGGGGAGAGAGLLDAAGRTALHAAAFNGSATATEALLRHGGVDPCVVDVHGRTALHYAAGSARERQAACGLLLAATPLASHFLADVHGRTPLHYAAIVDDDSSCVHTLLKGFTAEGGADGAAATAATASAAGAVAAVNQKSRPIMLRDAGGATPIHLACLHGHKLTVEWFLDTLSTAEVGSAVTALDNGLRSPLHYAAFEGHAHVLNVLIDTDLAEPNQPDRLGQTALFAAAYSGDTECVELLINHQADGRHRDSRGRTAPMVAALRSHADALEVLGHPPEPDSDQSVEEEGPAGGGGGGGGLAAFADPAARDKWGRTALAMACMVRSIKCIEALLECPQVDPMAADAEGMNALHVALRAAGQSAELDPEELQAVVEALCEAPRPVEGVGGAKADADADTDTGAGGDGDGDGDDDEDKDEDEDGDDEEGDDWPKRLAAAKDAHGRSALHVAAIYGLADSLGALIELAGSAANEPDCAGHTPLHYACYHGRDGCVTLLTDEEVQWQSPVESPFGPLHCAAARGHGDCLETLFYEAAEALQVNGVDGRRRTPLHLAAAGGFDACVEVLTRADAVELDLADATGATPLLLAAARGHRDVCCTLIGCGADFKRLIGGSSVIHLSLASVSATTAATPTTAAAAAAAAEETGTRGQGGDADGGGGAAVIEAVLDRLTCDGAEAEEIAACMNAKSASGDSPLHLAASTHNLEAIQCLLQNGAVADAKDAAGLTPLARLFGTQAGRDCLEALLVPSRRA
jgi:ankyrin repeat protein